MSSSINNLQNLAPPTAPMNASTGPSSSARAHRAPNDIVQQRQVRGRLGRGGRGSSRPGAPASRAHPASEQSITGDASSSAAKGSSDRSQGRGNGGNRGGRYRQRKQANQLLEGLSDMADALDIDLTEPLAPLDAAQDKSNRGRHGPGSRKITHLLNHRYEQRGSHNRACSHQIDITGSYRNRQREAGSYFHKFNKQQFLQANCQFIVLDGHDYTVHKVDPDWPVEWGCIEEVRFKQTASTETTCPICLEPPVAAKITRCGHIYCWTCMLHYLSLSDENCRQCPICFEAVYQNDLRSVISFSFVNHSAGEDIVMRLMIRKKDCVEVEPFMGDAHFDGSAVEREKPWSHDSLVIIDSETAIRNIVERERSELLIKLELDKEEHEVCFVEQALNLLNKRAEKLQLCSPKEVGRSTPESNRLSLMEPSKSYLFYQCADGQHIYLNPFSTKVLCHEYGSLESCPIEIKAKILQMDWISMNEAWRRRFRYLGHLPLTCEFRLVEIDFTQSNIVSDSTCATFKSEIQRREEERQRRLREERKREKIIRREQDRKIYGIQPSMKLSLDNMEQFPSVSDQRYLGLSVARNRNRSTGEFYNEISSDDESNPEIRENQGPPLTQGPAASANNQVQVSDAPTSAESVPSVTLSFREIQLQEEALAKKAASKGPAQARGGGAWASKQQPGTSGEPSSSFAQKLADAKNSQKAWTKNVSAAPAATAAGVATSAKSVPPGSEQRPGHSQHIDSDDGGEELRAPPCEFTIIDFMDMNVVSGTGSKRRGKQRGAHQ